MMTVFAVLLAIAGVAFIAVGRGRASAVGSRSARVAFEGPAPSTDHDDGANRGVAPLRELAARYIGGPLQAAWQSDRIERELLMAGVANRLRPEEVLAAQAIGAATGALLGVALSAWTGNGGHSGITVLVCLVAMGACAPRVLLRRRAVRRQQRIEMRVSDALDLLSMCVEAGLAFDAALATVGNALPDPLGGELERTISEIGLGLHRDEAFENLRRRNESPALDAFVIAVLQADQLGTPIGRVLTMQAGEARVRRHQLARERAAKLPVRILLPTVLLIFPPTFVVLLAPAFSTIRGALG
jgi:tight adherence protein C